MDITKFTEAWLKTLPKGVMLDLGAGEGRAAKFAASQGFQAIAVDLKPGNIPGVTWLQEPVEGYGWEKYGPFRLILARNVLQFLEKKEGLKLVQRARELLKPGGVLIIETFTKQPEPPFPTDLTFYQAKDFLHANEQAEVTVEGSDLEGKPRKFHLTQAWFFPDVG